MSDTSEMTIIGVVVGAILVLIVGFYAVGAFGPFRHDTPANVDTVTQPAGPAEPTPTNPPPQN